MLGFNRPRSSAISNPRGRRYPWYENQNEDAIEIGYIYETKLIFSEFDHDGGYNTDIVEKMQEKITSKWPKFEIVHAKLHLINYYYSPTREVDENQNDCPLNDDLKTNTARIKDLLREIDQDGEMKIADIYKSLVAAVQIENEVIHGLTINDFRPNHETWVDFIETIQCLNFWCLQSDICSEFNILLGRKGLKTNFCDISFAKIEALIVCWLNDFHFLEFNSVIKLVESSDDLSGEELDIPFSMDSNACQIGGASNYCGIGLIQADHFEVQAVIRYMTKNMLSANNYNNKPFSQPFEFHKPMDAAVSACLHDDQVITIHLPP